MNFLKVILLAGIVMGIIAAGIYYCTSGNFKKKWFLPCAGFAAVFIYVGICGILFCATYYM